MRCTLFRATDGQTSEPLLVRLQAPARTPLSLGGPKTTRARLVLASSFDGEPPGPGHDPGTRARRQLLRPASRALILRPVSLGPYNPVGANPALDRDLAGRHTWVYTRAGAQRHLAPVLGRAGPRTAKVWGRRLGGAVVATESRPGRHPLTQGPLAQDRVRPLRARSFPYACYRMAGSVGLKSAGQTS